jgi:mono/diheme cytochrome c family protein
MSSVRSFLCGALIASSAFLVDPLLAETKDVFAFIPAGGRTLLEQVVTSHPPADELQAILTGKHTRQEWLADLKSKTKSVPALQKFSDQELTTLADYLSFNMPLASGQSAADLARADLTKALPPDGRDFALEKCQGCHIITVVITQVRPVPAWLGTMNKPSHTRIKLSKEQREALASYLVLNGGIPIEQVPEELRAGGATY